MEGVAERVAEALELVPHQLTKQLIRINPLV